MNVSELFITALEKIANITGLDTSGLISLLSDLTEIIHDNFGDSGVLAAHIAVGAISLLALSKLFSITFAVIKYVAFPSVALALLASYFFPEHNFTYYLPVTVSLTSVFMLIKS